MNRRPLILVTNDDGITSRGIRLLIDVAKEFGDVVVVAPNKPQSGMGHAITIGETLRLDKVDMFSGVDAYECSGTPADCVKMGKNYLFKDKTIDLVLSGINHGNNTSISVIYSGTMSAAIEAAIENIPAIGFSLCDYDPQGDLDHCTPWIKQVIEQHFENGIPSGVALNVNFPKVSNEPIKGFKMCRQARAGWQEVFEERTDPTGRRYFWMAGDFVNHDKGEDTDEWAIAHNYVSIVPCQYDMTAYHALGDLNEDWDLN